MSKLFRRIEALEDWFLVGPLHRWTTTRASGIGFSFARNINHFNFATAAWILATKTRPSGHGHTHAALQQWSRDFDSIPTKIAESKLFALDCNQVKEIADYFLPTKPGIAADGAQFKCSNCGHISLYKRNDLIYQANSPEL